MTLCIMHVKYHDVIENLAGLVKGKYMHEYCLYIGDLLSRLISNS